MRWGILGPGRISRSFLTGLAGSATEHAVAIGSRAFDRAEATAQHFGVSRAYGSYEQLLADRVFGCIAILDIGLKERLVRYAAFQHILEVVLIEIGERFGGDRVVILSAALA